MLPEHRKQSLNQQNKKQNKTVMKNTKNNKVKSVIGKRISLKLGAAFLAAAALGSLAAPSAMALPRFIFNHNETLVRG
jgi:hypothetical protein